MRQIFKNLFPYWRTVIVLVVLLMVQAYCDLALPQYTQDIIDVGIQNRGVEHILPSSMTKDEYHAAQIFMTKDEKTSFQKSYKKSGNYYDRKKLTEEKLDKLDDKLMTPIVLTYQMGHTTVKQFKKTIKDGLEKNPTTKMLASQIDSMSVSEIGDVLKTDIDTFKAKDEKGKVKTYVDMRPLMQQMIDQGVMDGKAVANAKKQMQKTIDSVGTKTVSSMGIAYAAASNEAAGINVEKMQKQYLWRCGGQMALMAAGMLLAAILVSLLASRVGAGVGQDLRNRLFTNVMGFSNGEMDKFSTASLITRSTNDVQQIQMVSTLLLRMLLYAPVMGVWGIIKVIGTGAHMGWVILLGVLVIVGFLSLLMAVTLPKFRIMQSLVDALNRVAREILTGLSVIRAFCREKTEEERFDVANTNLMKTQLFTNRVMTMMMPGMMLMMNGLVVLITWVSAHRIDQGSLQVGAMTAFITYSMMIVMAFMMMTAMSIILPRAGVAANRIAEIVKTESSIKEEKETLSPESATGEIVFSHVDFKYPGAEHNVLTDIDFTVPAGKTTAIIGSTGSGKSSVISLIPRFYDVTGGSITIDGVNIQKLSLKDLRNRIGLVPQKGVLFSGTIASNIRFGKPEASDEEVRKAADIAQATEFIDDGEDGYERRISQGGSNVSGGQKQRLAIARAIVKKPEVMIFDDSFSALDMKTDAALRKRLEEEMKDTTQIVVAQRISTILHADQILVMDGGHIVGKGIHQELMETCSVYQQIAKSQLSSTELGGLA